MVVGMVMDYSNSITLRFTMETGGMTKWRDKVKFATVLLSTNAKLFTQVKLH